MSKNAWLAGSGILAFVVYLVVLVTMTPGSSREEFMVALMANPGLGLLLTVLLLYSVAALLLSGVIWFWKKLS